MRGKRRQIPSPIGEWIVFENHQRVVSLFGPSGAQGFRGHFTFAFVAGFIDWASTANDANDDIWLKLVDVFRRQCVDSVTAIYNLRLWVCFRDLFGDPVGEIPNVITQLAPLVSLRRVLALTFFALANCGVAIGRHHRDRFKIVGIKQDARVANGFLKQTVVRITELTFGIPRLEITLPAIEGEPLGMFRKGIRVVGHAGHSVSHLNPFVIAGSEAHRPHRGVVAGRAEAEIELSEREIRLNRFVDFGQRNGFHRRKHFTQITRQIPPGSQLPEKATNRIETAAFIQSPDVERFLRGGRSSVSLSCLTRQSQPVFVKPPRWHAVGSTNDLLPLRLRSRDVAVVTGKGMFRLEVLVVPDQR